MFLCTVLDRFFQTSTASSDTSASHLDQHGLIVSSTAAITCTSDLASTINHHTVDHQQHQIDKHGNLLISPKSEVL